MGYPESLVSRTSSSEEVKMLHHNARLRLSIKKIVNYILHIIKNNFIYSVTDKSGNSG